MATRSEILRHVELSIEAIYGTEEARIIARIFVSECFNISLSALIADPKQELEIRDKELFNSRVERLREGTPIQYVLGYAEFDGMRLNVNPKVLIPRPETEELILNISQKHPNPTSILDVGTGSGAIAIALKRRYADCRVVGIDISKEALKVATENSLNIGVDVEFRVGDALNLESSVDEKFDIILSNPPYISQREESTMRINVTHHEPHIALFVPDNNPLLFYRAIARSAKNLLNKSGSLWFEIHELFEQEMLEMLQQEGFSKSEVFRDFNNKPRMIWSQI